MIEGRFLTKTPLQSSTANGSNLTGITFAVYSYMKTLSIFTFSLLLTSSMAIANDLSSSDGSAQAEIDAITTELNVSK